MENVLRFFLHYNLSLLQKKKGKCLKFRMRISWFLKLSPLSISSPHFTFKIIFMEYLVNYKLEELQVFFPWPQKSSQSQICARSYGKRTETMQDVSISGFFQFWLWRISFFPFLFSNVFDFFNASKSCSNWSWPLDSLGSMSEWF